MNEYVFLYIISFIWVIFAVIQDLKFREIANWLTFSLIAFVLSYRAIYSIYSNDFMFFVYGLVGILLFIGLGYLFYYSRVFAGGDAKLLFGLGGIFPYSSFYDYIYYGAGYVFLLFACGIVYTLIYSLFLLTKNYSRFRKDFVFRLRSMKYLIIFSIIIYVGLLFFNLDYFIKAVLLILFLFTPILFAYVRAIESSCMIKLIDAKDLTEGDWLDRDVLVGGKIIKKNFEGLNFKQILLLRKFRKKLWIKSGVPFAPAFLLALVLFLMILRYSPF